MNGPAARIAAQAKLNLHLRVLSREDSGYHSIETIFHKIDLADDVRIEITANERTLDVEGADTGPVESNLAWKAASLYASHNGWPHGFVIHLTKRIPMGAGLGGGSADAAAVLRVLDFLSPQPMPRAGLLSLAGAIGSDVPFLTSGSVMSVAWGRGERMLSLQPLPRHDVLLMSPEFSVATQDAYRWIDDDRGSREEANRAMGAAARAPEAVEFDSIDLSTWSGIAKFARNDFEGPVAARHPEIAQYLARLRNSRAIFAGMTGSGSTVFGILDSPPNYAKVPEEHRARVRTTSTSIDVVQPVRVG
ncbi:MAG TPA: 4-(cytidine 5'-diphospho)-2-C-methyl-D-erythritol kinase [Gemmatimonadaceae bacterium]|nr:4-(cytidine 5'-diphospho)-2-C-methyl-D-erythritol kinase [Gemmatimonadaceae bacterium]